MKMYGPAFNEKGKLVERDVPDDDVPAYIAAGYVIGELPKEEKAEETAPAPKKKGK